MDESIQKTLAVQPLEAWRKVLLDAADLIERDGWCQGQLRRGQQHCAIGAIEAVDLPGAGISFAAIEAINKLARGVSHTSFLACIPEWNDATHMTSEEVIHTMRMVAST